MPNHVHLIVTPATPEGLGRALGKAHRRHSAFVNARNRVTGHLFQVRFSSVAFSQVADLGNDALPRGNCARSVRHRDIRLPECAASWLGGTTRANGLGVRGVPRGDFGLIRPRPPSEIPA